MREETRENSKNERVDVRLVYVGWWLVTCHFFFVSLVVRLGHCIVLGSLQRVHVVPLDFGVEVGRGNIQSFFKVLEGGQGWLDGLADALLLLAVADTSLLGGARGKVFTFGSSLVVGVEVPLAIYFLDIGIHDFPLPRNDGVNPDMRPFRVLSKYPGSFYLRIVLEGFALDSWSHFGKWTKLGHQSGIHGGGLVE